VKNALRYALTRGGPLATGPFEVGAFARTRPGLARPDLQLFGSAFTFKPKRNSNPNFPVQQGTVEREPGFTVYSQLLRLDSEGSIDISARDPQAPLSIAPNWLASSADQASAIAAVRYVRKFMAQPAIAPFIGREISPGASIESDAEVLDVFRRLSRCGTHAVGVCRMGGSEDDVCDPRLRVRGVSGVRVVDCSVMPGLISGNTNAPAMALAWHAATMINQEGR
jgi:choline dehydrogenase-like flavoprotein